MRKVAVFLTAFVLVVPTALAAAAAPQLRVASRTPLTIAASGFRPGERVTVALAGAAVRHVRAGAPGSFVVTFDTVRLDRCSSGLVIRATGAQGSVVWLKIPRMACLPARAAGSRD